MFTDDVHLNAAGAEQFTTRQQAVALGADRLIGVYCPTAKNGMVRDHYASLGFDRVGNRWVLALQSWKPRPTFIDSVAMERVVVADGGVAQ